MEVYVVKPYGCCHGVNHAINMAKKVKSEHPNEEVHVLGMLVHNEEIINELTELGIYTLHDPQLDLSKLLERIRSGIVIFTAHGHNPALEIQAKSQGLMIYDATCHYVQSNHELIKNSLVSGHQVIFIGKENHPETVACLSYSVDVIFYEINKGIVWDKVRDFAPVVLTQTTLSILELKEIYKDVYEHFPNASIIHEVCSATRIRQTELMKIPNDVELIYVVGSSLSSNTAKLAEIADATFRNAVVKKIKTVADIDDRDLENIQKVAVTAGASTPLTSVETIIDYLKAY